MYCKNCGKQIDDDSKFCFSCGQVIEISSAAEPIEEKPVKAEPIHVKPIEVPELPTTPKPIKPPELPMTQKSIEVTGLPITPALPPMYNEKPITPPLPKMSSTYKNKKHRFGKFIKILLFLLLSIPVLALITFLIVTISSNSFQKNDSNIKIESIVEESKEDLNADFNSGFVGVWKLSENRTNPDNASPGINIYEYSSSTNETYVVIFDNNKLYNISYNADGVQISNITLEYDTHDGYIIGGIGSDKLPENAYLNFTIGPDSELMVYMFQNDKAITDFSVYTKTQIEPSEFTFPILPTGETLTTSETTIAPTPNITPTPVQNISSDMKEYASPVFETEIPLYTVLTKDTWVLIGVANNPNKTGGEYGAYTLESLNDYMIFLTFRENNILTMIEDNKGESLNINLQYEIIDLHFCDTYVFADGTGYRFYLGSDGLLYMCEFADDMDYSDFSDFKVFGPLVS